MAANPAQLLQALALTTAQRNSVQTSLAPGAIIWNTNNSTIEFWNGSVWGDAGLWQVNGSTISPALGTYSVGVGTTNATSKFDLYQDTTNTQLSVRAGSTYSPVIYLEASGANAGMIRYLRSTQNIQFENPANSPRVYITTSGEVGIGTPTITSGALLDVRGAVFSVSGSVQNKFTVAGSVGVVGTKSNHDLQLYTNDLPRVQISSAGSFDVLRNGSTANKILSIDSAAAVNSLVIDSSGNITASGTVTPTGRINALGGVLFNTSGGSGGSSSAFIRSMNAMSSATNPDYTFWVDTQTGIFHPSASTLAFTVGGTEAYRVNSTGCILIGGTLPGAPNIVLNGSGTACFAGTLTAATPSPGDNTGKVATTAFVTNTVTTLSPAYWTRTGTLLAPTTSGDCLFTSGSVFVGNTTASPNISLNSNGTASFGGAVTGVTATTGDSSTKFATTAFVAASVGASGASYWNCAAGVLTPATSTNTIFTAGNVRVGNTSAIPTTNISSDGTACFGGIVTATTPTAGDNSTKVATTAFVTSALSAAGGGVWTLSGTDIYPTTTSNSISTTGSIKIGGTLAVPCATISSAGCGSFSGNVVGLTATNNDCSTKFATTAFVCNAGGWLWSRSGTEISPATTTDTVFSTSTFKVGGTSASPKITLNSSGTAAFTGDVTVPTQASGDNSTKVATTAFVQSAITTSTGPWTRSGAVISPTTSSDCVFVSCNILLGGTSASPNIILNGATGGATFTASVTGVTELSTDSSTKLATTAFVTNKITSAGGNLWCSSSGVTSLCNSAAQIGINSGGGAAAPGLTVVGDATTGIYSAGTCCLGVATNGVGQAIFDNVGNLLLKGNYIIDDPGQGIVSAQGTGASILTLNGRNCINFTTGGTPTGGTIRATLDASGNLGLGVEPSAWASVAGLKAFDISTWTAVAGNSAGSALLFNTYYGNTGYTYKQSAAAGRYELSNSHRWFTAPSGFGYGTAATSLTSAQNGNSYTIVTAGNTDFTLIGAANNNVGTTFTKSGGTGTGTGTVSQNMVSTQAMTLDASGQLFIGQTSSSALTSAAVQIQTVSGCPLPNPNLALIRNATISSAAACLLFIRNNSTTTANTALDLGDVLGAIRFCGTDGTAAPQGAAICAIASAAWTPTVCSTILIMRSSGGILSIDEAGSLSLQCTSAVTYPFCVVGSAPTGSFYLGPTGNLQLGGTGAIGIPSGTTAQQPASPTTGWLRFNTSNTALEVYNGTAWSSVGGSSISAATLAEAAAGTLTTKYSSPQTSVPKDASGMTGAAILPSGTTAQQPASPAAGWLRFNTSNTALEVHTGTSWVSLTSSTSTTGALTIPSGTTAQQPGTPTTGMIRYNTTTGSLEVYNGSSWSAASNVGGQTGAFPLPAGTTAQQPGSPVTGYLRYNTTTSALEVYDGTAWTTVGGGGALTAATLAEAAAGTLATKYSSPQTSVPKDASGMTGAALIPGGTVAQRPTTGVNGMWRYNCDSGIFEGFTSCGWQAASFPFRYGGTDSISIGGGIPAQASCQTTIAIGCDAFGQTRLNALAAVCCSIAIGTAAGLAIRSGIWNVGVGHCVLNSPTACISSWNTAIGGGAMRCFGTNACHNTAVGYEALCSVASLGNVGIGGNAGDNITTGSYNTALGFAALTQLTTGSSNISIGYYSMGSNVSGSNNISIDSASSAGVRTPAFDIANVDNRISMGTTAVTNAYIQVAWTVVSDLRDKICFEEIPHGLSFVKDLKPVSFHFRKDRDSEDPHGPRRYGFKAQDILALEGDSPVIIDAEDPNKLRYNGEALVPVLTKAIKELSEIVETLQARIAVLESQQNPTV